MPQNNLVNSESKKKWLPYLVRGILGIVIAATMFEQFLVTDKPLTEFSVANFPIYIGFFFLMNGLLSLKLARSAAADGSRAIAAAVTSIIGGLLIIIIYPFSSYRTTLVSTALGRLAFGAIVIILGALQIQNRVTVTRQPALERPKIALGGLEILFGITVIASPINKFIGAIAFAWVVLVVIYMFYLAHILRRA
jgi:uncharacterized membrane protein HdeD (DUF308 family)